MDLSAYQHNLATLIADLDYAIRSLKTAQTQVDMWSDQLARNLVRLTELLAADIPGGKP